MKNRPTNSPCVDFVFPPIKVQPELEEDREEPLLSEIGLLPSIRGGGQFAFSTVILISRALLESLLIC
jgi:hypothetical protein